APTSEAKHGRLAAIYRLISLIWSGNGSQPFWRLLPSLHQLSEFFNGRSFIPALLFEHAKEEIHDECNDDLQGKSILAAPQRLLNFIEPLEPPPPVFNEPTAAAMPQSSDPSNSRFRNFLGPSSPKINHLQALPLAKIIRKPPKTV
ncbi:MAG: hypothetical protein SF339_12820, partial [Blastocatellia bacterium]|nr:hypothetical protein [Blastocatellia bacterium]